MKMVITRPAPKFPWQNERVTFTTRRINDGYRVYANGYSHNTVEGKIVHREWTFPSFIPAMDFILDKVSMAEKNGFTVR